MHFISSLSIAYCSPFVYYILISLGHYKTLYLEQIAFKLNCVYFKSTILVKPIFKPTTNVTFLSGQGYTSLTTFNQLHYIQYLYNISLLQKSSTQRQRWRPKFKRCKIIFRRECT